MTYYLIIQQIGRIGGKTMIDMKIKQEENVVENSEEKKELSTEYLSRNPRVSKMEVSDQIFFAYEKQRSHN